MTAGPYRQPDPIGWCAIIALGFLGFCLHHLALPSIEYFDEVHYVKAARRMLQLLPANPEHPLFAKELIAASIALLGDKPLAWRLPSALLGSLGLFAFGRLVWLASGRRLATILAMALLATNFMWFIESRIAMLDMASASLAMVGLWQFAAAPGSTRPRLRLALSGIALGLALGAKWSAAPVAMLPGLAFLVLKLSGREAARALAPITMAEAVCWLGLLPVATYWLTYAPAFFYHAGAISPFAFIEQHREMIALQDSVRRHHPYQSMWADWIINRRPIWYLYQQVDGAQRGILQLGNPLAMLAGLPALAWCMWATRARCRLDAGALAIAYLASLGMWAVSGKPVQFYYHYLLAGAFLMGCLALALAELWECQGKWRRAGRAAAALTVIGSLAMFAWFYPIISAAPLSEGHASYVKWMWLRSWR